MLSTHVNDTTPGRIILAVALELSQKIWKIALQDGLHDKPSIHSVSHEDAAKRLAEAEAVIEAQKKKWDLPSDCKVVVMYEAGQDGFWIYRALLQHGYEACIIDPASIPVERHARRAKTDRLDAIKLVNALRAHLRGERDRMHVIRVNLIIVMPSFYLFGNALAAVANKVAVARWRIPRRFRQISTTYSFCIVIFKKSFDLNVTGDGG